MNVSNEAKFVIVFYQIISMLIFQMLVSKVAQLFVETEMARCRAELLLDGVQEGVVLVDE